MSNPELNPWFEEGVLPNYLGLELIELDQDRVVATMPVDERQHQHVGYLHGGVSVFLAETVAGIGAMLNCSDGKTALGSEVNASHVRPKGSGTVTAIATPVHKGGSSQVWEVVIQDEDEKPVSIARCTLTVTDT